MSSASKSLGSRLIKSTYEGLWPLRMSWAFANRQGWLGAPPIGSAPTLDPAALERWRAALNGADVYLEYGAGGSTLEAVGRVRHVVSVETDRRYMDAVAARVSAAPGGATFHPVPVDIGWTSKWGRPVMATPTRHRVGRWREYPAAPWALLEQRALVPDFIFVDGRFRVASILESFCRLPEGSDCLIMLDDYERRADIYGAVLPFAEQVETAGRAIAFRRKQSFDRAQCLRVLDAAYADPS